MIRIEDSVIYQDVIIFIEYLGTGTKYSQYNLLTKRDLRSMEVNIDAKIELDTSDGINNVKIFCYDLTMLFKGHNHRVNFLFHDSRLFDGIDERQKADIFKIVYEKFTNQDKQYIATVNQNQLDEVKRLISKEEYENIFVRNTVLTLTDEADSQKLLGIKVDIGEN